MKVYGFPLSPFVRKVVVALKEKGLDFELVPSNPQQPDEEFAAVSPFHKIPAFRDGNFSVRLPGDWTGLGGKLVPRDEIGPWPYASGRAIQRMIHMAGNSQPIPATMK